jgi:hypothetical protein
VWSTHYRNAEFCYKQIIDISENSWGIGYQNKTRVRDLEPLVNVYLLMGDTAKAISTIQEIITLGKQPDGREVHNYKFLGDVALRLENDTAALACFHLGGLNEEVENVLYRRRDFNNAEYFIRHHFDSLKNDINQKIVFERESEREITWNQHNHYITPCCHTPLFFPFGFREYGRNLVGCIGNIVRDIYLKRHSVTPLNDKRRNYALLLFCF